MPWRLSWGFLVRRWPPESLADELLLQHYAPPAVLVNSKGDIVW
ncbi:MAG TPA: hypothetical protein VFF53_10155 [Geobacteraceae bacterium]|nr:hypothetical protein [Geobacteraceae bacterium]